MKNLTCDQLTFATVHRHVWMIYFVCSKFHPYTLVKHKSVKRKSVKHTALKHTLVEHTQLQRRSA